MPQSKITYGEWKKSLYKEIATSSSEKYDTEQRCSWFWVLDASAHPELPGLLWQLDTNPDAWPLYMNTFLEDAIQAGPWFIPCQAHSKVTQWIFEQLEQKPLGFLFSVNQNAGNSTFEHLQNILECVLPVPQGEKYTQERNGLFRYYDPRVIYGLSTFQDTKPLMLVKGPILSLHAWEPGRAVSVEKRYTKEQQTICLEPPKLSQALIDHLWKENQAHTIIATLSDEPGEQLRAMSLPKAYQYVESIQNMLKNSPYTSNSDIGFATAYSLLSLDEEWEDVLERIVFTQFRDCPSLDVALKKAFAAREN